MKKTLILIGIFIFSLVLVSCNTGSTTSAINTQDLTFEADDTSDVVTATDGIISFGTTTTSGDEGTTATITMTTEAGSFTTTAGSEEVYIDGDGNVIISGSTITISTGGTYMLTGYSANVQIFINVAATEKVTLVLDNADLTSLDGPVINAEQSDKLIINVVDGTINMLSDASSSTSEIKSCIFSNDDITINGTGTLIINANYNNGINTDDDLRITNGNITINAANNCLKANDSVQITTATLILNADNNAIHVENTVDTAKGNIMIDSGTITISAYGDGMDASNTITITGGSFDITSGVGNTNIATTSAKGLKGTVAVLIASGTFDIVSKDDAIHANTNVQIDNGEFTISSSDDGIHADTSLTINGGIINITKSYEGIESINIIINGGTIHVVASDDGLNAAGGNDGSSTFGGWPGSATGNATNTFTGGYIYVNSKGDGVDANGSISMSGGTVIVSGPTDSGNGPLDYDSTFTMTGGQFVAAGSSGMAQNISSSSTQYGVLIYFSSTLTSLIRISDASGGEVITFKPEKSYQCLLVCSPNLKSGQTYSIYTGGNVTAYDTQDCGYYTNATYTIGALYSTFTIQAIATTIGSGGMRR
ncbi:MAG: carbohydrate-binding domain-containing protein [Candidatus Izemoplasmatales bacterium]|nr:carbohydrate-binding domain-containing protein [Candidatus Izemoplasmatales bacterium]